MPTLWRSVVREYGMPHIGSKRKKHRVMLGGDNTKTAYEKLFLWDGSVG